MNQDEFKRHSTLKYAEAVKWRAIRGIATDVTVMVVICFFIYGCSGGFR